MKWYYNCYGDKYNWVKAATEEQAYEWLSINQGFKNPRLLDLTSVISDMTNKGWVVNYRDESIITFSRKVKKSWGGAIAFWFFAPILVAGGWYILLASSGNETEFAFYFGIGSIGFCWSVAGLCSLISIFQPANDQVTSVPLGPKETSVTEMAAGEEPILNRSGSDHQNAVILKSSSTSKKKGCFVWVIIAVGIILVPVLIAYDFGWINLGLRDKSTKLQNSDEPNFISVNGEVIPNPKK